jgi:hypothetical protein
MSVAYAGINRPGIEHQLRRRESHKFAAVIRIEPLWVVRANAGMTDVTQIAAP